MQERFCEGKVTVKIGDITEEDADAIVNAANSTLLGGGGVDGAIHRKGGSRILEECKRIRETEYPNGLPTGKAVITTGGELKARFVIHTVGPVYGTNHGEDSRLLAECYKNSLELAAAKGLQTVAFPSISTGVYQYPKHEAARVSSRAVKEFLEKNDTLREIRFVFFSESDARTFLKHHEF